MGCKLDERGQKWNKTAKQRNELERNWNGERAGRGRFSRRTACDTLLFMPDNSTTRITVIDSHTAGEPTRVVIAGGPDLGTGSMAQRRERFGKEFDWFRAAVVHEPRGADVLVGALLLPPVDPCSAAGVIFFNNVGCLQMCGHATIGLVATLAHLGRIAPGEHRIETPVGNVTTCLEQSGQVAFENVAAYRHLARVPLEVEGYGRMHGDVAWGGNWFCLVEDHGLDVSRMNIERLSDCAVEGPPGALAGGHYRGRRAGDRPRRTAGPARAARGRRQELRALPRPGL